MAQPFFIAPDRITDIPFVSTDPAEDERILGLAQQWGLAAVLCKRRDVFLKNKNPWFLQLNKNQLGLHYKNQTIKPLAIDCAAGKMAYRAKHGGGMRAQAIARAVGLPALNRVLDLTAGLAQDSFILASLGCQVTMLERCPVIAALIDDALHRLALVDPDCASRMQLLPLCAVDFLNKKNAADLAQPNAATNDKRAFDLAQPNAATNEKRAFDLAQPNAATNDKESFDLAQPNAALDKLNQQRVECAFDVIYLDPMFPASSFKQALVKKEMRMLHALLANDINSGSSYGSGSDLLHRALLAQPKRVVVKRPLSADPLLGLPPSHQLIGKSCRFDVYCRP